MALSTADGEGRPAYLQPSLVGLVVLGGTVGTAVRDRLETVFATPAGQLPWATFGINVSGAFLLGFLLEVLALVAPDGRRRRGLQLAVGTGLLGGYTTYSTFILEAISLGGTGTLPLAVGYAAASLATGFAVAFVAMGVTRAAVRATWRDGQ